MTETAAGMASKKAFYPTSFFSKRSRLGTRLMIGASYSMRKPGMKKLKSFRIEKSFNIWGTALDLLLLC